MGSRVTKLYTHIHQVLRDSGVDPITNKKIFGGPLNVADRNDIIFHMMEIKPPKDHGEEGPPLGVVVHLKIQRVWQRDLVATLWIVCDMGMPGVEPALTMGRAGDEGVSKAGVEGALVAGVDGTPMVKVEGASRVGDEGAPFAGEEGTPMASIVVEEEEPNIALPVVAVVDEVMAQDHRRLWYHVRVQANEREDNVLVSHTALYSIWQHIYRGYKMAQGASQWF
jgi:hypothetical protein